MDSIIFLKISSYLSQIVPLEYRKDPKILNSVYFWLLIGIFIRFLVMPFAFHGDLLSTYHRSYLMLFDGYLQYLNPQETIQAVALWIFSHITPAQEFLVWTGSTTASTPFWLGTLENTYIFRTIFLLKLPYLFFDVLTGLLILHIFRADPHNGMRAFIFWILNPVVIFAVYIFGRYEVIPIFFILLCIYFLKENSMYLASLSLGIAIVSRYYALLFLPLLIILYCRTWMERAKVLTIIAIPVILYNVITILTAGRLVSADFAESRFVDYLLGMNFNIGWPEQKIFIFVTVYICILLFIYYKKKNEDLIVDFIAYSLIILLLIYATSLFHPQYFAWFIPFLALYYGYTQDKIILELHCLQVICFIFYTFYFEQALATWMFASINPELLIALPSPVQLLENLYPGLTIVNMIRSVLSAVSLFMIAKIILNQMRGPCE